MDEFGVLVESIGFKAQGRSTPMADLKSKINANNGGSRSFEINSGYHSNSVNGLGGNFRSSSDRNAQNYGDFDGFDDVFGEPVKTSKPSGGGGFDFDSIFNGVNNTSVKSSLYDDDIFGGMPGLKTFTTHNNDDLFGSMASPPKQSAPVEDLLGNYGGMGLGSIGSRKKSEKVNRNAHENEDLLPGFGGIRPSTNREYAETSWSPLPNVHSNKATPSSVDDPFIILEQSTSRVHTSSGLFSEDTGKVFGTATDDLDSIFGMAAQPSSGSRHNKTVDPVFDALFQPRGGPVVKQPPSGTKIGTKKASPTANMVDDFSFFLGDGASSSEEFQEIEGESTERRRARLNHHMRTQQRMATALAQKNQRDFQTQQEQEERYRIAETLDEGIKHWAAGKEGNLRALLSSLQTVLWPGCGWQQVSLTDLITTVSVKKVYLKAALCVHPDKVQQKGASIQQKYTAEKVFDLLKEAWNKFNSEEL